MHENGRRVMKSEGQQMEKCIEGMALGCNVSINVSSLRCKDDNGSMT